MSERFEPVYQRTVEEVRQAVSRVYAARFGMGQERPGDLQVVLAAALRFGAAVPEVACVRRAE